ncbi:hypothetical protein [Piscinibacter koreensis]|uniref:Methyltransferase domain-containing protein n=1 Tax=Piscinibacter koreensis TaxID=2742824 RepID=A0A7Y6NPM2_9BURK|nr:hypothetical protein [Schlegelella koreensis]NUZ06990.1 hypothetical protein [Schlegelella koreensis]
MGVDVHSLALLAHARDLGARFDRTLGIGRQAVFVDPHDAARIRGAAGLPTLGAPAGALPAYFEPLLAAAFGASQVDSIDASPYENATFVHDMNRPLAAGSAPLGAYDAVLDFGCLEHVFDFPTAWRNCVAACKVGGHLLHALPANNLLGHGFYQFSPELFFSLYRPERGFELRAMFVATKAEPRHWWRVADPRVLKRRVTLRNGHELYLLVVARKLADVADLPAPQQSDYAEQVWTAPASVDPAEAAAIRPSLRRRVVAGLAAAGLLDPLRAGREHLRALRSAGFDLPAPDFERVDVLALLREGRRA